MHISDAQENHLETPALPRGGGGYPIRRGVEMFQHSNGVTWLPRSKQRPRARSGGPIGLFACATLRLRAQGTRTPTRVTYAPADQPIRARESMSVLRLIAKVRHTAAFALLLAGYVSGAILAVLAEQSVHIGVSEHPLRVTLLLVSLKCLNATGALLSQVAEHARIERRTRVAGGPFGS
jgi:hypothetical protein